MVQLIKNSLKGLEYTNFAMVNNVQIQEQSTEWMIREVEILK